MKMSTAIRNMMRNRRRPVNGPQPTAATPIWTTLHTLALLAWISIGLSYGTVVAQQSLTGQVRNPRTTLPIAGATVQLNPGARQAQTDDAGRFSFSQLPAGTYQLTIKRAGYEAIERVIHLRAAEPTTELLLELNEQPLSLETIVVTGTMKEGGRLDSPVPVEVYSNQYFLQNPTTNFFDAMAMVNGLQAMPTCNVCATGELRLNGMPGPYTQVLIDGMPIVSALSAVYGLMGIPNAMIERVEVIKGPASTLYSSEALAGLINIITKDNDCAPRLHLDYFTTTYNEHHLDIGTRVALSPKTSMLLGLNTYQLQQRWDVNKDGFTDVPLASRYSGFTKWKWKRPGERRANLFVRYLYEDRWGGEMNWRGEFRGTDSVYGESIFTSRVEAIGNYDIPLASQTVRLSGSYVNHDQNSVYGSMVYLGQQQVAFGQATIAPQWGRHEWLFGAAYRFTAYDDNTQITASGDSLQLVNKPSYVHMPGIFVQDELNFNERHRLLLGARLDYVRQHGLIPAFRLNYLWKPTALQRVRISAGNGFRVVNVFTEDHAALSGFRQLVIREELKPERSWNASINYTTSVILGRSVLSVDASAFYTYFTNQIFPDYATDANKVIYANLAGYAVSRGLGLSLDWNWGTRLRMNVGMTYLDVFRMERDVLNQYRRTLFYHTSPFMMTGLASYNWQEIGLKIDYTMNLYAPMELPVLPNDFRPSQSPWMSQHNLLLTKNIGKYLQIYGGVKNIFDFMPLNPIMRPFDPFDRRVDTNNPQGYTFDAAYTYAPLMGRRGLFGVRWNW
jgi:outer membrane receptor for ferrienterochelin and colicins